MRLINLEVESFINEVDSNTPAPGGGSVSGVSALLGVALGRMVGHVTIPKKAFAKRTTEQQETFQQAFDELHDIKQALLPLVDEDTKAFNRIMQAYKMPKETKQEQYDRKEAIELATIYAIDVPLLVANYSFRALKLLPTIEQYGNKNALSDVGVAALQLTTAILGSLMNVKINVSGLKDEEKKADYIVQVETLIQEANGLSNGLIQRIFSAL